jgi:hypothetical protein
MTSARLPALLAGYASGEAVKDAVRNREAVGNRGKLVGSGRRRVSCRAAGAAV